VIRRPASLRPSPVGDTPHLYIRVPLGEEGIGRVAWCGEFRAGLGLAASSWTTGCAPGGWWISLPGRTMAAQGRAVGAPSWCGARAW